MTAPGPARPAISVTGLRKSLGGTVVLDGTDLAVPEGMIIAGLDPLSRRTMREMIRGLAATGVTIFLTTQYLDKAGRIAVLHRYPGGP